MTYEIEGQTAAEHAEFFGPEWYDDEAEEEDARSMDELIRRLAYDRKVEAEYRQEIAEIEAEIAASPLVKQLERARELLKVAQADVADSEEDVRKAALEAYQADGSKKPHPAVAVKVYTVLDYDPAQALDYARQHLPQAVKLDKRMFEKVAKVADFPFVDITTEPRVTIARDLTEYEV